MIGNIHKHCPECGAQRVMRYPGGEPEDGPARLRCPSYHQAGEPCDLCSGLWHEEDKPDADGRLHNSWGYADEEEEEDYA